MTLEDFLSEAKKMGYEDFQYKSQEIDGGRLETFLLGMPVIAPKLPQEAQKVVKSDNIYPGMLLPPKDAFIYNLRYLLDLAKATKEERSVMNKLIKRFENTDKGHTPRKAL